MSNTIKNNYSATKQFENPDNVDIKSVNIEPAETSDKLSKTIRQTVKVSQVEVFEWKKYENNKVSTCF